MTIDAAWGSFLEDDLGSLEPGKLADLIVTSANPLDVPPMELFDLEVLSTVIGGETVYCAEAAAGLCP
jgi:predicted amidohydrolase YtcJ